MLGLEGSSLSILQPTPFPVTKKELLARIHQKRQKCQIAGRNKIDLWGGGALGTTGVGASLGVCRSRSFEVVRGSLDLERSISSILRQTPPPPCPSPPPQNAAWPAAPHGGRSRTRSTPRCALRRSRRWASRRAPTGRRTRRGGR